MKICMVTPWFPSLNADTVESQQGIFEYRQAVELSKMGNEFKVISIKWHGQSDRELITDNIEVYRVHCIFVFPKIRYPIPNFVALTRKIRDMCTNWKPDIIIYSHMVYLTTLPVLWFKNRLHTPSIVTTDAFPGISWFYGNRMVDGIGYLYSMLIGKRVLRLANGVQLVSSQLSKYMGKFNLDSNKTFLIPRGVDTELFKPRSGKRGLRNKLGIGQNDTTVLYVGRLDLVKGVSYLLQAAERILANYNHNNVKFLIVGDGNLGRKYEILAKPFSRNIIFTGWRKDVPQLMNIADIFVLPSLSEGAANVALEASASGLPVIATEVGEVPQIVSNGKSGILLKPKDVDGLAEAISRLINNPSLAKKMGEEGRKRMEEEYRWEIICKKIEDAYLGVIDRYVGGKNS